MAGLAKAGSRAILVLLGVGFTACALDFGAFDPRTDDAATTGAGAGGAVSSSASISGGASTASNGGAGGTTSSVGGGGGTVELPCGGLGVLSTDFTAGLQPMWWDILGSSGSTLQPGVGAVLEVGLPAPGYAEYISKHHFRLDDHLRIELVDVSELERLTIGLVIDNDTYLYVGLFAGTDLRYSYVVGDNTIAEVIAAPFDPVAHRWLQIRRTPTGVVLEVSEDGINFAGWPLTIDPADFDLDHVRASVEAQNYDTNAQFPVTGTVDNLSAGVSTLCGSDTAVFNFKVDGALPPATEQSNICNTRPTTAGLVLDALPSGNACEVWPQEGFTPTSVVMEFAAPAVLDPTNETHYSMQLENGSNYIAFGVQEGRWACWARALGGSPSLVAGSAYDPTLLYWRMVIDGGLMVASAADASLNWTDVCQIPFSPGAWPYWLELHQHPDGGPIGDDSITLSAINP